MMSYRGRESGTKTKCLGRSSGADYQYNTLKTLGFSMNLLDSTRRCATPWQTEQFDRQWILRNGHRAPSGSSHLSHCAYLWAPFLPRRQNPRKQNARKKVQTLHIKRRMQVFQNMRSRVFCALKSYGIHVVVAVHVQITRHSDIYI